MGILKDLPVQPLRILMYLRPLSPDGKVRPAIFSETRDGETRPKIVNENRYIDGQSRRVVILDSIASMANRMEAALYEALYGEGSEGPRMGSRPNEIVVDLDDGRQLSVWQLPHRLYDAYVRMSICEREQAHCYPPPTTGTEREGDTNDSSNGAGPSDGDGGDGVGPPPFFVTDLGRKLALGKVEELFRWSPNVLIYGGWNSHPEAHKQAGISLEVAPRIERAVTAEVVGLEPEQVARSGSRMDPRIRSSIGVQGSSATSLSEMGLGMVPPTTLELDVSIKEAILLFTLTPAPWRQRKVHEKAQRVLFLMALLGLFRLFEKRELYLRSNASLVLERAEVHLFPEGMGMQKISLPSPEEQATGLLEALSEATKDLPGEYQWSGEKIVLKPSQQLREIIRGRG